MHKPVCLETWFFQLLTLKSTEAQLSYVERDENITHNRLYTSTDGTWSIEKFIINYPSVDIMLVSEFQLELLGTLKWSASLKPSTGAFVQVLIEIRLEFQSKRNLSICQDIYGMQNDYNGFVSSIRNNEFCNTI